MSLIGENDELRIDALQLERRKELKALIDRNAEIEFSRGDKRRRIEVGGEFVRRPFLIQRRILPRHSLELPIYEPDLFGRRRHRLEIVYAGVRHKRLELESRVIVMSED